MYEEWNFYFILLSKTVLQSFLFTYIWQYKIVCTRIEIISEYDITFLYMEKIYFIIFEFII